MRFQGPSNRDGNPAHSRESRRNAIRDMRTNRILALGLALTAIVTSLTAYAESADELRNRILSQTKVVVTELAVPAREYKGDGDPNTLEIELGSQRCR